MVTRMGDKKRPLGRPRYRQEDIIEIDVKSVERARTWFTWLRKRTGGRLL
jgi:hypothetical protein